VVVAHALILHHPDPGVHAGSGATGPCSARIPHSGRDPLLPVGIPSLRSGIPSRK
jgi:hypothetical protein